MIYYFLIFIVSLFALSLSGPLVVDTLSRIAKYLGWREFVVGFFLIAFAASLPNFVLGITAALKGIPELSFGDVVGGNVVDLSLAVALVILLSRVILPSEGTSRASALWSSAIAILPLLLILDGELSRPDGLVLIFAFLLYICWLFSKGERFKKPYDGIDPQPPLKAFKGFMKDLGRAAVGLLLLVFGAQGVVASSTLFAQALNVPLPVIGILIIGLGNSLPEIYFAISSAKKGKTEMILGDLMGSVIVPATLVLGIVVLIHPIRLDGFSAFVTARIFLVLAAILFYIAARTGKRITRREAFVLLGLYIAFVAFEILFCHCGA
ncbi:MAG: hypothetical protein A2667_00220 [Candidatus Wildermuthbacteria bacterium RIFCSPHIGHO2_01_FULL_47_27]|uniref:Sodium/calcium exchanger membrane region domain-containing protein n=2 Tax=Candidatus Wildermuthiibacteriota TaxID=1817923 RepID=A0A1G2RRI0_9BACT|nr:MAG: Na+/Ca+ antiporter, CaCA family [Parcubacteria group bacterium GW2011_GWA2_47_9]OHA63705.1 MAG: hypothetical protein A2667_00220 [Candidatus Wildermuthbacteria bacterium RIFCSPHIGHO2_01_FULL_47_27]OHA68072.1 MAG: hypothetical protein A3D59_04270 [Candidatus Wildermuthbacteria bacterium RIFCSPHIGHO2_02_FULL_47_17]OHA74641.1 MAG: hypothetical protein A3A32_01985 [Candidatus Wildermuthbacteria bacterium RIFCSPLOWO2_01_FULL_48_35]OHA75109.1 MAG: hypothetical protein A3I38_00895 [Candidatus 